MQLRSLNQNSRFIGELPLLMGIIPHKSSMLNLLMQIDFGDNLAYGPNWNRFWQAYLFFISKQQPSSIEIVEPIAGTSSGMGTTNCSSVRCGCGSQATRAGTFAGQRQPVGVTTLASNSHDFATANEIPSDTADII